MFNPFRMTLNREVKTIASAATIVAAFSFLSRFVGFIRDRILAGHFGAGDILDSYYAAFLVPDTIFNLLVVGALSASFIPLFSKHLHGFGGKQKAWDFTNNVVTILGITILIISAILFFFTGPLAEIIAPGFSVSKQRLVAEFTRIMFISDFLLAISAVFGSVLQGMKRFLVYSFAPILYNIGIITGALVFTDFLGPAGLAWGVVFGAAMHFVLQLIATMSTGYRYRFLFQPKDVETKEMGRLMLPRTMGVAVNQLNAFVMVIVASTLVAGSVTVFNFAYNIQFFVVGIFGVSFAVAAFPTLSEYAARDDHKAFVSAFSNTVRQMLYFIIPSTVLFLLVRSQIVRVVVGAGKFGWTETIMTADTLAFFTLSFFAQGLVFLLARAFFAYRDTATPFVAGLVSACFNVIAALLFTREFGVMGLAMAFSLSSIVNLVLLWLPLRQKLGSLNESAIVQSLFTISIAAIVQGVVTQGLKVALGSLFTLDTFTSVFFHGFIAGGIGLLVYLGITLALKSPEAITFIGSIRRHMLRSFEPSEAGGKDQSIL